MITRAQVTIVAVCAAVVLGIGSVVQFVQQQRAIGAMQVVVKQEQTVRDSLAQVVAHQHKEITRLGTVNTALDRAAARALARARTAEARFDSVIARVDTQYADVPDTTKVPVTVLWEVRDEGQRAVRACQSARDSIVVARDSLSTECALVREKVTAVTAERDSYKRELDATRAAPRAGRIGVFVKGMAWGAAALAALVAVLRGP